ncbi:MAG: hypothetical protein DHS20C01_28350 [marine bacterium B5-7]|nr:MAG: hypothetical protein DHS20C01_28350 [marine bacterium B5-7]
MNRPEQNHHLVRKQLASVIAVLLLSGCSVLDSQEGPAYQRARQAAALEVPPDLSAPGSGSGVPEFVAAEATAEELTEFEKFQQLEQYEEFEQYKKWKSQSPTNEQLDFQAFLTARQALREGGQEGGGVSIDRNFDKSRDIRIKTDPTISMEIVGEALANSSVEVINRDDKEYKFLVSLPQLEESTFLKSRADQFTLALGRDQQDTIVALRNRRGESVTTPQASEFMNNLAGQVRVVKIRLELENRVATAKELPGSLESTDNGHLKLDFNTSPEGIWNRLDYVIDQIGFTVIERDPASNSFKIRYLTDDQIKPERTGLSALAFWNKDDGLSEGEDVYIVKIDKIANGSSVRVINENGEMTDTGDNILELLREQL